MNYASEEEARAAGLKPGEAYGYDNYVRWRKEDLDPNDMVTFMPGEIPNQRYREAEGKKYITIEVNGLTCLLTIGVDNTVNRVFYDAYRNSMQQSVELEELKRKGLPPTKALLAYSVDGTERTYQWYYKPEADTAWMDQNGRPLRPGQTYTLTPEGMPLTDAEMAPVPSPKPQRKAATPKRK